MEHAQKIAILRSRIRSGISGAKPFLVGMAVGATLETLAASQEAQSAADAIYDEAVMLGTGVLAVSGWYRAQGRELSRCVPKGCAYAAGIVTGQLACYALQSAASPAVQQLTDYLGR